MTSRFEQFSASVFSFYRSIQKIERVEMEKYGLKGPHSIYLVVMHRFPDGITAPQLCEYCGKDKSDVSRMMSIMEQKGLVTKESVHQNRYGGIFRLTEEGWKAAEFVCQRAALAVELAGKELSAEVRAHLYAGLESIAANLRDLSRDGLPIETDKE